jgi:hypothetical protein
MVNKGLKKNKTMDCNFFINFLIDFRAKKKRRVNAHPVSYTMAHIGLDHA